MATKKFKSDVQLEGAIKLPNKTAQRALIVDASGDLVESTVTDTELGYMSGVTSALQTQMDNKVSADGSVTTHSDVTDAGSGAIITSAERTKLTNVEALADVTDATNVDAAGAVMESDATTASMSFVIDEDNMASDSATKVPTQQSVKAYTDAEIATALTSATKFKGDYNAATNTPDLDTTPIATDIGDTYVVTAAGTFFTVPVEIGDKLMAKQATATLEAHWSVVQANLTPATIKTQYESNADTNEFSDAEQTKLAGIETAATADQTGAQIKVAYEAEADTNAFTDAEKTNLGNQSGTNTGDEAAASTTVSGVSEIATSAEIDTGTDDTRTISPLGLAGSQIQTDTTANNAKVSADGSVTSHSDVTSAGSGIIISGAERTTLGTALQPADSATQLDFTQTTVGDWTLADASSVGATLDEVGSRVKTLEGATDSAGFDVIDTKANLDALSRVDGKLYYASDEKLAYYDNGTTLLQIARDADIPADTDALTEATNTFFTRRGSTATIAGYTRVAGKFYYDTSTNKPQVDSGSVLKDIALTEDLLSHSTGDISETSFAGAADTAASLPVTGLAFNNAIVRAFSATVSVVVDATADLYEVFTLNGIQRGADWVMTEESTGDDSLITFDITPSGQIQYSKTTTAGWVGTTVKFRAITTGI